jgi:hypothetical protein
VHLPQGSGAPAAEDAGPDEMERAAMEVRQVTLTAAAIVFSDWSARMNTATTPLLEAAERAD